MQGLAKILLSLGVLLLLPSLASVLITIATALGVQVEWWPKASSDTLVLTQISCALCFLGAAAAGCIRE